MKRRRRRLTEGPAFDLAVSLLLAVLLWVYVGGQRIEERTYFVPVEVDLAEPGLLARVTPPRVAVTLRGAARILAGIASEDPEAGGLAVRIAVAASEPGTVSRPLDVQAVEGEPAGVEVLRVTPSEVRIEIEREAAAERTIELEWAGETAPPGGEAAWRIEPSRTTIRGPEGIVRKVRRVPTEPVADPAAGKVVPLRLPPEVRAEPGEVTLLPAEGADTP